MYAMSGIKENNDRIYKIDDTLDIFVDHAKVMNKGKDTHI